MDVLVLEMCVLVKRLEAGTADVSFHRDFRVKSRTYIRYDFAALIGISILNPLV